MFFLAKAWSAFISLNPCLARYILLIIPHSSDCNYWLLFCLWIFKFWMDSGTSEGRCIYQFNAWLDRLIINHHCWQLSIWYSVQGSTSNKTTSMWSEKKEKPVEKCAERRGKANFKLKMCSPPGYIFTLAEHAIVKCLPLQMAIFLRPCVLVCGTLCH